MRTTESNYISKKCGEIIITIKKNTKNVYSFNCFFCDTICIQMKKFTMHLEQEHGSKLEECEVANSSMLDAVNSEQIVDSIKVETILEEQYIKSESSMQESCDVSHVPEGKLTRQSQKAEFPPLFTDDPLGPVDVNVHLETILSTDLVDETEHNQKLSKEDHADGDDDFKNESDEDETNQHEQFNVPGSDSSAVDEDSASDSDFMPEPDAGPKRLKKKKIKLEMNEEIISALIAAYKNKPQLWANGMGEKLNSQQKEELFQELTEEINKKYETTFKSNLIRKEITRLQQNYQKEIEQQIKNPEENDNSQLWYSKEMEYLKETLEHKFKNKRRKPKYKVKPLNNNLLLELIDIYKNYNSLWDVNHLAFSIKDKRDETMEKMLEEIKSKMNLTLDIYKLEKHLSYLHKIYADEKRKRLQDASYEKESQDDDTKCCIYYEKCDFLEPHQGPYKCATCMHIVATYNEYQVHLSQHDGSDPFKCPNCGMGFRKFSNFKIHAKRHLQVFKFHCDICGKGYPFNAELDLHMRSHTGAQPFLCSLCGEGFRTAIGYDNHIRRHEERFKYFCDICKKGFNHLTILNNHVKAHLNVRDIICPVCGKGFTSRKYLNYHRRIHEGKNYTCNICGKSFAQDAGLRAHKKYHGTPIGLSSAQKDQDKYSQAMS